MKRFSAVAVMLVSGLVFSAAAQTPSGPLPSAPGAASGPGASVTPTGSTKIAVIAFEAAVSATNEFQRNLADLQKKWGPKQQQLKAEGADVDNQTNQLQTQGDKLSDAERASRAKALDDRRKTLERNFEDARDGYQQELQTVYNNTATKVYDVLASYAEKNGYTLVLDYAAQQQTPVVYALDTTDITKAIADAYNVKSGVPAPAQPPAAGVVAPKPTVPKMAAPKQ
jgi:outer membrane protein